MTPAQNSLSRCVIINFFLTEGVGDRPGKHIHKHFANERRAKKHDERNDNHTRHVSRPLSMIERMSQGYGEKRATRWLKGTISW